MANWTHPKVYVPLILLAFLLVLPLLPGNPFHEDIIVMIFFWGTLASAWNILGGYAGQISIGHAAFFGIGAYTSTILYLRFGISPWIGMFAGAGVAVCVATIIGIPCFRLKSHFFALATIAFAEVLRIIASFWRGLTEGGVGLLIPFKEGLPYMMFRSKIPYAYISLGLMLSVLLVSYLIKRSRFGYYLFALKENQDAAESLGVKTTRVKLAALLISVFFTAIAGSFYAQYILFVDPSSVIHISISVELALLSIIGGLGTLVGPIIGAFVLGPLGVFLRGWLGGVAAGMHLVVYGVVLIVAVTYFPKGIMGWLQGFYDKLLTRLPGWRPLEEQAPVEKRESRLSLKKPIVDKKAPLFEVKGLGKSFGGLAAVKDVDFKIERGEILGLIGPNGAGKTTIFNLVTGFIPPDTGTVTFDGKRVTGLKPPHKICLNHIGRTFQIVKPFNKMTVLENVMVGAFSWEKNQHEAKAYAREVMSFVGIAKLSDQLPANTTIADKKRLELARALATRPDMLLLDEVAAGLNPIETEEFIGIIRKISDQGITILMIEHVMKAIMTLSDRVVVLNHGEKIAEGAPEVIAEDKRVIEAYLGEEHHA